MFTIDNTGEKGSKSSKVSSSCEQTENDSPSSTIDDNTERRKSSVVSSRKHVQTPSMVYDTTWHTSSKYLNNLNKVTTSLGLRYSDRVARDDKSDFDSLHDMTTNLRSKGSDRVVSDDDKSNLEGD